MGILFLQFLARSWWLALRSLWPPKASIATRSPRRLLIALLFVPGFVLLQLVHWCGFLLDELLFRGYRRVPIRKPVFILGVPRSGTTFLHNVLSDDPQFTTFSTWECLLAPSVTERKLVLGLAWIDRRLGAPGARLLRWAEDRLQGDLAAVHPVRLSAPEEDYFALTPALACFILIAPFPFARWVWDLAYFDTHYPPRQRQRLMDFYQRLIQRHLYVHGDKTFLSKNAAFAGMIDALTTRFEDGRFVCCVRDPVETVPSQLSALDIGMRWFCNRWDDLGDVEPIIERFVFYYDHLAAATERAPDRVLVVADTQLKDTLEGTVMAVYRHFGLAADPSFETRLHALDSKSREHRSTHRHAATDYGLTEAMLTSRFAAVYPRLRRQCLVAGPATTDLQDAHA
ncbi:MAG: sulfotransferase [Pseudomonadota bacterium]|nr:sulfotransferase [Pseudomonadota bacterium]